MYHRPALPLSFLYEMFATDYFILTPYYLKEISSCYDLITVWKLKLREGRYRTQLTQPVRGIFGT